MQAKGGVLVSVQPSTSAIKAAQAVNFFLQTNTSDPHSVDGNMYLKIIKLLWAADRLSLRNFGSGVTEDDYCAMKFGPVASNTYNLVKACKPNEEIDTRWVAGSDALWWKEHFETRDYSIQQIADLDSDYLSQADLLMLDKAYGLFRKTGRFETAHNISHIYPEWTRSFNPQSTVGSFPIDPLLFFEDPEDHQDRFFQVDPETLETARYFFDERSTLSESVGIAL